MVNPQYTYSVVGSEDGKGRDIWHVIVYEGDKAVAQHGPYYTDVEAENIKRQLQSSKSK